MQSQIIYDRWFEVDTKQGTFFVQQYLIGKTTRPSKATLLQYVPVFGISDIYSVSLVDGYGARLSMPGYLDCTDWTVFETKEQAERYISDLRNDD